VINSATLTLHLSRTIAQPEPVNLHRVLADWGEGASNANAEEGRGAPSQPGDATWLHTFYDTAFWTSPGGDFDPAISASTVVEFEGYFSLSFLVWPAFFPFGFSAAFSCYSFCYSLLCP
jgi:hypothetical protein